MAPAQASLLAKLDTQQRVRDTIGRLAAATNVAGATRALEAVATAERNIARNVTPQLAIEVMLFDIRKALKCR